MDARVWRHWRRAGAEEFQRPFTGEERAALRESNPRWYSLMDALAYAIVSPILGICCGAVLFIFVMLGHVCLRRGQGGDPLILFTLMQVGFVGGVIAYFRPLIQRLLIYLELRTDRASVLGFEVREVVAVQVFYDPAYYPDSDTSGPDDEWEDTTPWAYFLDLGAGRLMFVMVSGYGDPKTPWLPRRRVELVRTPRGKIDLGFKAVGEQLAPIHTIPLLPIPESGPGQYEIIRGTAATLERDVLNPVRL